MDQKYKSMLQEGVLTDLLTNLATGEYKNLPIVSDMARRILGHKNPNFQMGSSIAKEASSLTAVFPVLVTDAVALDDAVLVSKALERKCVAMLQMLFAANQITDAANAKQFLGRFHKNVTSAIDLSNMDVDDVIEYSNDISNLFEESVHAQIEDPQLAAMTERAMKAVEEDVKYNYEYKKFLPENINENSLNSFKIKFVYNEAVVSSTHATQTTTTTSGTNDPETTTTSTYTTGGDMQATAIKNSIENLNKRVLPSEIKKANEATPSMIVVVFKNTNAANEVITSTAVIGVKAIIHYIPSSEMMARMAMKNSDKRGLLNFIRATTGEIAFFRDFLFAIDRAKVDAVAKSGRGSNSKIWKMLELRAHKAKLNMKSGRNNANCAAITSIVLSKEEAELIKKEYRIDVQNVSTLSSIMKGYNFMMAAIIDAVNEKVNFLYDDGTKAFETLSFTALEREASDGLYKKVINMISRKG